MKHLLIIGNGLAGIAAAIHAADLGCRITIVSHAEPERSQSVMAGGGINAALNTKGENDSPEEHARDTLEAGVYLADETAVREMTKTAPALVTTLGKRGVIFSREADGAIALRSFGGQKKMRTAYAKSGIGKQLIAGLTAELRRLEAEGTVVSLLRRRFISPVMANGRCIGAVFQTADGSFETVKADAVIAASGGMGGLFDRHTGSAVSDGSVTAALFVKGAEVANLEMIQYHPTTVQTPAKNMLISEAARGEGGRLFTMRDGKRWYFMEEWYPEGKNLMARDIVSRAIHKVCTDGYGLEGKYQVGLELESLPKETLNGKLQEVTDFAQVYLGIDAAKEPIPVSPAVHYFMGGLYVDRFHRTTLAGLYAAGECACQYHGANRLGGNSTLGAIYGGRVAAETAAKEAQTADDAVFEKAAEAEIAHIREQLSLHRAVEREPAAAGKLMRLMSDTLSIIRSEEKLKAGLSELEEINPRDVYAAKNRSADAVLFADKLILARAVIISALERKESRGAHTRSDYPETNDAFRRTTVAAYKNGVVSARFEEIGREFA